MAIGAAIGAIGSFLGSVLGNNANEALNESQMYHNERMWRLNNEYNTPANQMKRLRQAGINPHFAIQGGQLGTGNSTSPAQAISPQPYDFSPIGEGLSRSVELFQQKRVQDADIGLKNAQAENQRLQSVTQVYRDIATLNKLLKEGDLTEEQRKQVQADIHSKWIDISFQAERNNLELKKLSSEKALSDAQTGYVNAQSEQQRIINQFAPHQQAIITSNLSKEGSKIDSEVNRNNREAAVAIAEKALKEAQKQGVNINNAQIREMSDYVVDEAFYKAEEQKYKAGNEYKAYKEGNLLGRQLPVGGRAKTSVGISPVGKVRPSSSVR